MKLKHKLFFRSSATVNHRSFGLYAFCAKNQERKGRFNYTLEKNDNHPQVFFKFRI